MWGQVSLAENHHEFLESHGLKTFTIKLDPVNEANIFNTIESALHQLVRWDIFVIRILPTGSLPINACLRGGVTCTHIWGFRVGLVFDNGNDSRIDLGEYGWHDTRLSNAGGGGSPKKKEFGGGGK